jgi:hypothetical protein
MDDITASIIVQCQTSGATQAVNKLGFAFSMLAKKAFEFGSNALTEFQNLQDATWKFDQTFKSVGRDADAVAKSFQNVYKLSELSAKKMLGSTGDLLTGLGFDPEFALKMADAAGRLGTDLAGYTNYAGQAAGAVEALTAALTGENEKMKALGVVIRQDTDQWKTLTKAFQGAGLSMQEMDRIFGKFESTDKKVNDQWKYFMKLIKDSKNLTVQQANAMAAFALSVSQSKNAIGDTIKEGESFSQNMMDSKQAVTEFMTTLGGVIYQVSEVNSVTEMTNVTIRNITDWLKKEGPGIILFLGELRIGLISSLKSAWAFFEPLGEMAKNAFTNIVNQGQWMSDNMGKIWDSMIDKEKNFFLSIRNDFQQSFNDFGNWTISAFGELGEKIMNFAVMKPLGQKELTYWHEKNYKNMYKFYGNIGKNTEFSLAKQGVTKAPELVGGFPDFSKVMGNFENVWKEDAHQRDALLDRVRNMFGPKQYDQAAKQKKSTTAAQPAGPDSTMVEMLRSAFKFRQTAQSAVMAGTADAARLQSRMFGSGATNPQQQSANSLKGIQQQMSSMLGKVDSAVAAMTGIRQNTQGMANFAGAKRIGH